MGNGVQNALTAGFGRVISIENDSSNFNFCRERFKGNSKVELYYGSSSSQLFALLAEITEPVVFWLDAHPVGLRPIPLLTLLKELEIIYNYKIKEHSILIDDMDTLKNTGRIDVMMRCINPDYKSEYFTLTTGRPNQVKVWSIK